ncbi:TsoY family (seleno)protein [Acuticoccus mangrovi]|uniref:Uncharacterized protein n=1 Tax=Acuticoccus mangrovi TaxID=2796142 RepID=A0A934IL91_9HYPH|nr:hypothetical protein [Acuticoccus mangrovi]MBJ3775877.1 hypothetical protein [Acuticoccus mangrovi]
MPNTHARAVDTWSPLYFLASVGAGGLAVSFFMYLMFWVPHPGRAVPVVEDIASHLGSADVVTIAMVALAMAGIAVFGAFNLGLLVWNLRRVPAFTRSERGASLLASNAETQLMAMPLALAMSVNVGFILGLVFVPGLWSVVEVLFPLAIAAFALIGGLALRQVGRFLGRVIGSGGFDCRTNNSFAQLLPAFTFAMIGVGLAAPGAMSATLSTAGISIVLSTFFMVAAVVIALVGLVLGVRAMMEHGVAVEQAPTLLIVVPITTVLGILAMRQGHGLHVHFASHGTAGDMLVLLSRLLSLEVLFLLFGMTILRATGYLKRFVFGSETSAGAYALICPGVALSVMLHFWINKGLVAAGVVTKFGVAYWALGAVALAAQLAMIWLFVVLHRRHFMASPVPVPATAAN